MLRPLFRALLRRLPQPVQRDLRLLRGLMERRPESTFARVAYSIPRQVVLITTRHDGAEDVWALDAHTHLSFEPSLYGIAVNKNGYGAELVRCSGVFIVNFVPATWETVILFCGNVSGRTVDKFAASGLRKEEGESVNAPRLADSLGALECKVRQTLEVGDHTLFIGEVTHRILRAEAPRLHHLDVRLREIAATWEERSDGPAAIASGQGSTGRTA